MGRPDVPVFPPVAAAHPGLLRPCPDAADNRRAAANLWDADHGAARRDGLDTVDAILEHRLDHPDLTAADAGKSAVREQLPADAVPDHLAAVFRPERHESGVPVAHLQPPEPAAEAPYIPDAVRSAA